jgi:hypothetical protein
LDGGGAYAHPDAGVFIAIFGVLGLVRRRWQQRQKLLWRQRLSQRQFVVWLVLLGELLRHVARRLRLARKLRRRVLKKKDRKTGKTAFPWSD